MMGNKDIYLLRIYISLICEFFCPAKQHHLVSGGPLEAGCLLKLQKRACVSCSFLGILEVQKEVITFVDLVKKILVWSECEKDLFYLHL